MKRLNAWLWSLVGRTKGKPLGDGVEGGGSPVGSDRVVDSTTAEQRAGVEPHTNAVLAAEAAGGLRRGAFLKGMAFAALPSGFLGPAAGTRARVRRGGSPDGRPTATGRGSDGAPSGASTPRLALPRTGDPQIDEAFSRLEDADSASLKYSGDIDLRHSLGGALLDDGGALFNVKHPDYGATGDGRTDDSAAIERAIQSALEAGGGTVYFPPGTYSIGTQLVMWPSVAMVGAGSSCTRIDYRPGTRDPALIMGDADWRQGGDATAKNWQMRGLRVQTSNGVNQGTGVYLAGIHNAKIEDVQVTGFTAPGSYGLALSGNPNALLSETSTNTEGHYNTLIGVYLFNNDGGLYVGGVANTGQSNDNVVIGGAIRQNNVTNLYLGPTNNNVFLGTSFEAKAGTRYGVYCAASAADNTFYGVRFEGAYEDHPFFFVDDALCKKNLMHLPLYGAGYPTANPTHEAFAVDAGARNAIEVYYGDDLIKYGTNVTFVAPAGGDISFHRAGQAVVRMGDRAGFAGVRVVGGFVMPTARGAYPGTATQGALFFDTDLDVPAVYANAPSHREAAFRPLGTLVDVPASTSAPGNRGHWATDRDYLYICTAPNRWGRVALTAW